MKTLVILPHIIFMLIILVVASKRRESNESTSEESYEIDEETPTNLSFKILDMNGNLKRNFAVEAAIQDTSDSMVCSPISALLPLGKLIFGATNIAKQELLKAIGIRKTSEVSDHFKKLLNDLQYVPGVTLVIASRIYADYYVKISKKFKSRTKRIFKSSVENVKMSSPKHAADEINAWVKNQTRDMIPNILTPNDLSPETSLVLVNAIYFAGHWQRSFTSVNMDTFISPTLTRKVPMMSVETAFMYFRDEVLNAQIVEIPYVGGNTSFILILPQNLDGLPLLLRQIKLAPEMLIMALDRMAPTSVNITMPKFKITSQLDLKSIYQKIGIINIFDETKSELSGIVKNRRVTVSKAIQKAVIEVNEMGTKAAAGSSLNIQTLSYYPSKVVHANHPFQFLIKMGNQQIFAGTYV